MGKKKGEAQCCKSHCTC